MVKCRININVHELKPTLVMVAVQIGYCMVNICYKLAANDGMNLSILVAYRFLFASSFLLPVAFFAERKKRPKLTRRVAFYGFLSGLFGGSIGQNLYLKGLVMTSATFVSALTNLVPAITFVVALSFRLEKLGWSSASGKAKVLGTMIGISGAMIITFYKGLELKPWDTHINLLETTLSHHHSGLVSHPQNGGKKFVVGAFLGFISCVCYSLWLICQAKAGEEFPCPYSFTAIMTVAAFIQSVTVALCIERDMSQWDLGWNIRLFAVAATGVLGSGVMFSLVAWCVRVRGPLFVSVFQPLVLVTVAIAGSLFLDERLYLGMVIGAILIVNGLYIVLWGKRKEMENPSGLTPENMENEARIDIPPPPLPSQDANGGSRAGEGETGVEVEEEAHVDMPPSQNGGNMVEKDAAARAEMPPLQNNNSNGSREEEEEASAEMPGSQNDGNSRSRAEEAAEAQIESPENSSRCSSGSRAEAEEQPKIGMLQLLQNDGSSSMKEAEVQSEVKAETAADVKID